MYLEPKSTSPSVKGGRCVTNMKRVTVSLPDAKKACYDEEFYRISVGSRGDEFLQ